MTISSVELYRYGLPLTDPLPLGDRSISERRGLLLCVVLESGAMGWGDIAPLPGFSAESLDACVESARRVRDEWTGHTLSETSMEAFVAALPFPEGTPASVRFGGESAIVSAVANARSVPLPRLLGADRDVLSLNALVGADASHDLAEIGHKLRTDGYRAVKLKVGRTDVASDAKRVRSLSRALGDAVALRLDANRAWSVGDARGFLDTIRDVNLEYIEEPLAVPDRLPELIDATGARVALDETTRERSPDILSEWPVQAVVLKPTLLGGVQATRTWAAAARRQGATSVVSASYESGVGSRMLAALALSISDAPAGLSPYTRLAQDVLTDRLPLGGSQAEWGALAHPSVERSRLQCLSSDREP